MTKRKSITELANRVFQHWNEQKGKYGPGPWKTHRKLTTNLIDAVIANLDEGHEPDDLCQAITNYAMILQDQRYRWTYAWDLGRFLTVRNGTGKRKGDQRKWLRFHPDVFDADDYLIKRADTDQSAANWGQKWFSQHGRYPTAEDERWLRSDVRQRQLDHHTQANESG